MLMLVLCSVGVGLVVGAPVGVAGALVADAALTHNLRRLLGTILGVALGDTTLAFIIAYFFDVTDELISRHENAVLLGAGGFLILIGALMFAMAWRSRGKAMAAPSEFKGVVHYLLGHAGPAITAFAVAAFHPGNVLAMLPLCRWAILQSGPETFQPWVFAAGLGFGSLTIFGVSALLFWKLRTKAGRFVSAMRLTLAAIVCVIGISFIFKYTINQQTQESPHAEQYPSIP